MEEKFEQLDVDLTCLTDFETVVEIGREAGFFTEEETEEVLAWHEDPENWEKPINK